MVEPLLHYPMTWRAALFLDPAATFMHTPEFIRYRLAARPGSIDRSLVLLEDDVVLGVAPLVQEGDTLLDGGEPAAWPLAPDRYQAMFIEKIARECHGWCVQRFGFRSFPGHEQRWWNTDWHTAVVDLSKDESELWRNVRGSYHAIVNKLTKRGLTVTAGDGLDLTGTCRDLHIASAGRETRPMASWEEQASWIEPGLAACYIARDANGTALGFAFVSIWNGWAYYFSGASSVRDVQHAIQWHVIRDLKRRGVKRYEIGWIDKDKTNDPKAQGIEMFKRGWGGAPLQVRALERSL